MQSGENTALKKYSASPRSSTRGVRWNILPMRARAMTTPVLGIRRIVGGGARRTPVRRTSGSGWVSVRAMEREVLSYCRICAAACGITVTVDGDRVVRVRGDADHPVSRGYTCSKGRGLAAWHHADARLDQPRLRGDDVSWDELLDDLGAILRDTVAAHGARRGRALPRHRHGVRRRRAGRGGHVPRRARKPVVLQRGHRRQRAGARGGGARHRQRDDEPAVGSDQRPASWCSSAPTPSSPTATAPPCPTR